MMLKVMHKWIAVIVFLQLFVWLVTGFLLGKLDHELATGGNTYIKLKDFKTPESNLLEINTVLKSYPLASEIALSSLFGKPVYKITLSKAHHAYQSTNQFLIDGLSGSLIELDKTQAIKLARSSYLGQVEVTNAQFLEPPIEDLNQQQNPVWRVDLADANKTSIFVNAQTGQVIAHVNQETYWRNLLLMLHFMDYAQQGSFNNIFMKIFAVFTFLHAITGLWWLIRLIRTKQFRLSWFSNTVSVKIHNIQGKLITSLPLKKVQTLLHALQENNVVIPSICGGGGVCGKCRFKSHTAIKALPSDLEHISLTDISSGYRLACQHYVDEVSEITLAKLNIKRRTT
jgi:ferredoxin